MHRFDTIYSILISAAMALSKSLVEAPGSPREGRTPLAPRLVVLGALLLAVLSVNISLRIFWQRVEPSLLPGEPPCRRGGGRRLLQAPCGDFDLKLDLESLLDLANLASQRVLAIYNAPAEVWQLEHKADASPVTRADLEANALICEGLARLAPGIPILSEEGPQAPYQERQAYKYAWVVDPLDGTRQFLERTGEFTINIALLQGSRPILGVVAVPAQGQVYYAVRGHGAFVRAAGARQQQRLWSAEFGLQQEGLTVVGASKQPAPETRRFLERLRNPVYKKLGSSLKLLQVAEGSAHVYLRMVPSSEWDTAAAQVIVEEAGGAVLQVGGATGEDGAPWDWQGDLVPTLQPLEYNKPSLRNPYFVAVGKRRG